MLLRFFVFVDDFQIPFLPLIIMGFIHGIGHCAGHHDDEIPPNINRATFWRKQLLKIGAKLVIILALSRRWPGWNVLFPGGTSRFQHLCDGCSFLPHRFGRNSHGRFPRFLHGLRFCPCSRFLLGRRGRVLRFLLPGIFPEWLHSTPSLNIMRQFTSFAMVFLLSKIGEGAGYLLIHRRPHIGLTPPDTRRRRTSRRTHPLR